MRIIWLIFILMAVSVFVAGCFNKDEKQSMVNLQDDLLLLGSSTIVISEVYYDTVGDDNVEEYIELYNKSTTAIAVGSWTLTDNATTYTIPSGTNIPAKSTITVARNAAGFKNLFGVNPTVSGMTLALGNTGDNITLKNASGTIIDFVSCESYTSGWSVYANTGYSIERNPVNTDTDTNADWKSNVVPTPGSVPNVGPGSLKVHFIDVGQGDCILVQAPTGEAMLIDAGSYQIEIENKVLNYLANLGLNRLDVTVATHPHSDHIGSLDAAINRYPVLKAYDSGYAYTSISYTDYTNALINRGVTMINARRGNVFYLGSVKVEVLSPTNTIVAAPKDVNEVSIVLRVSYGNTSFILTGDASQAIETEIMNAGYTVDSDVLKVGHHGSYTATAPSFVDAVTPTVGAVILVGEGNSYGHPHTETMNTLNSRKIRVLRTDLDGAMNGNIVMTSTGSTISVSSYY